MKIGIILSPFISQEISKSELVPIDDNRPWLQNVENNYVIKNDNQQFVSDDVSIAYYLKDTLKSGHDIVLISPIDSNSFNLAKSCDVNFLIIFDLLESFHTLPKKKFTMLKKIFELPNIIPYSEYQKFVNNKNIYYKYFQEKGVNILPFIYISKNDFDKDPHIAIKQVLMLEPGDDKKIIGKPVFGQDSIDVTTFSSPVQFEIIERFMEKMFHTYSGLIFQPFIKDFKELEEYKIMFIGDKPEYMIKVINKTKTYKGSLVIEGTYPEQVAFAKYVFSLLPKTYFKGIEIPKLMTRIDIGCCYNDTMFLSEVEFVPSLFLPEITVDYNFYKPDVLVGNQIKNIICILQKHTHKRNFDYIIFLTLIIIAICIVVVFFHVLIK